MKQLLFLLGIVFTFSASAQESTLISGDIESGGFDGPVIKVTNINGEHAMIIGDRGGYGLVIDVSAKVKDSIHQYVEMWGTADWRLNMSCHPMISFTFHLDCSSAEVE
jgi:hypothetical protein